MILTKIFMFGINLILRNSALAGFKPDVCLAYKADSLSPAPDGQYPESGNVPEAITLLLLPVAGQVP